ncbi:subtilase family protein [Mycoplasmopsis mustelae]|uniref:Subtilase family protein n=1 Tax=Mycoplasmopsis mustelae TaxID=171289 RepID=A0A4V6Q6B6_9BACT|nr:S8 family serine peptidase [Mycoplasmopsis mustelae]TDV24060.1 subtilase family protein [Mycoplasmopsis mustelae]
MKKIKLKLLFRSLPIIALGAVGMTTTIKIADNWKTKEHYKWYHNYDNNKLLVRKFRITTSSNDINHINSLKNYELKVLLDHKLTDSELNSNENIIKIKNDEFLNKVNDEKLIYKNYKTLDFVPIIWFYFNSEEEREYFFKKIKNFNSIFQVIIFDQTIKKMSNNSSEKDKYYRFERKINNNNDKFLNFIKQKKHEDNREYNFPTSIGILEANGGFDEKMVDDFKNEGYEVMRPYKEDELNHHSQEVPMIAAGSQGIDRHAKLYFASFKNDAEWNDAMKWFAENGIKVVNHSYGEIDDLIGSKYNENNLLLDYYSRKYGMINVFSSGNGNDNKKEENEWINGNRLSFNNIVVGALKYNNERRISSDIIADYSNYLLFKEYESLSKPNVVAPGYLYDRFYEGDNKIYETVGTSFASPIVAGLATTLLREKGFLDKDYLRIQAIKAILAVSSWLPKDVYLDYKSNGYSKIYGAGIPDFEKMLLAADNLKFKSINKNLNGTVLISNEFYANKDQTIKAASSWLFNAGIIKREETSNAEKTEWWKYIIPFYNYYLSISNAIDYAEWIKTHRDSYSLKLGEALKRQNNKWFSDYDLYLEKKNSDGSWNTIKKIYTENTVDELIIYKVIDSGTYRVRVEKYKDSLFENSIDDSLVLTYLVS